MELGKTLYVTDRKAWREWLEEHHETENEIWLLFYRKESGKPRIPYDDAVEEALCFGWIDNTVKKIDADRFAQRFSKRKRTSGLSQLNKERVVKLIMQGKMTKAGLDAIAHVFDPNEKNGEVFEVAPDILTVIKEDKQAWDNFQKLPGAYKRIRIGFIESRRRHGDLMFQKSLRHFVEMTAKNKRFGLGKEIEG